MISTDTLDFEAFLRVSRKYLECTEVPLTAKISRTKVKRPGRFFRAIPAPRKFSASPLSVPPAKHPADSRECSSRLSVPGNLARLFIRENLLDAVVYMEVQDIEIDLSEVGEIDSDCLQFIVMAKREAARLGKGIHFNQYIDPVIDLLDLCDLAGIFAMPDQIQYIH